jgi:hypothetical protein
MPITDGYMSYYTFTQISWNDSERSQGDITSEQVLTCARSYLRLIDWPQDAARDLESGLLNHGRIDPGFNQLRGDQIIDMFRNISESLRDVTFFVRGMGEEVFDIWAASVRDGEIVTQHGPFDE